MCVKFVLLNQIHRDRCRQSIDREVSEIDRDKTWPKISSSRHTPESEVFNRLSSCDGGVLNLFAYHFVVLTFSQRLIIFLAIMLVVDIRVN